MKNFIIKAIKCAMLFFFSLSLFAGENYRIVVDKDNVEVKIPQEVNSVVNLWPSFNGTMIFLGAGDKITYPSRFIKPLTWTEFLSPNLKNRPNATDNIEELLKISPDLVIVIPRRKQSISFRNSGLTVLNLDYNNYEEFKSSIRILGDALGGEYVQKSIDWGILLDKNIADVKKAVSSLKENQKPLVYYISAVFNDGLYTTAPKDSIQNIWVDIAGGRFASSSLNLKSKKVSAEAILKLNPDIIIIGGASQYEVYKDLLASPAWKDIKAVKNSKIYLNPHGAWGWDKHGAETILQIPYAASVINPKLYKVDMNKIVKEYYKKFANVELSTKQAQNMLDGFGPKGESIRGHKAEQK